MADTKLPLAADERTRLAGILTQVEKDLTEDVLPFWTRNTWDDNGGGFITHLDRFGKRTGVTDKYLVMQTRMIWTLSAAHRHGLKDKGYLELATKGVHYIRRAMWDAQDEGFLFAVRQNGEPVDARKYAYGQSFAIYALAEHALASGDTTSTAWAQKTFDVLQRKAKDDKLG